MPWCRCSREADLLSSNFCRHPRRLFCWLQSGRRQLLNHRNKKSSYLLYVICVGYVSNFRRIAYFLTTMQEIKTFFIQLSERLHVVYKNNCTYEKWIASGRTQDWIKISEMLFIAFINFINRVPTGFTHNINWNSNHKSFEILLKVPKIWWLIYWGAGIRCNFYLKLMSC